MKKTIKSGFIVGLLLVAAALVEPVMAQNADSNKLSLPALFSDDMVVQRNRHFPVWGTAAPGQQVEVIFKENRETTVADGNGKWKVFMKPQPAGGPFKLTIIGQDTTSFQNVMCGEVWVASGQSNMEMPLAGWGEIQNYKQEIANANYPDIRLLQVQKATSPAPVDNITVDGGKWRAVTPETIPQFSSAAYFFGRNLYENLDVPIGLIHSSWGGTVAEAWTSGPSLKTMPDFASSVEKMQRSPNNQQALQEQYQKELETWKKSIQQKDEGYANGNSAWASVDLDDSGWKQIKLPQPWENGGLPNFDGIVWFRKKVDITDANSDLTLHLGPIDDNEITWFNGHRVGSTDGWTVPREYSVPAEYVHEGPNYITVRVLDTGGEGGFRGEPEQLAVMTKQGEESISLTGEWKYKASLNLGDIPPAPASPDNPNRVTVLYNAMMHPLMPYAMRGVIWYQGESNAGRAEQYRTLFPLMIKDWRQQWGEGKFPFLFVQLANFMARQDEPGPSDWAELRDAQMHTLELPNTGMAVAIDIGNPEDIHPKNKQEVGRRLALIARGKVYGEQLVYSGPLYRSMEKMDGNKIRISFNHVGDGLEVKGDRLKGFSIAGKDKKFHWADAKIVGDQVVISSPEVQNPVAVRYGWASNPDCNLYNESGLPASPFRTDLWNE